MGFADLHVHTIYSYDGTAAVPAVLKRAKQVGLDLVAITDHDEFRGALRALELAQEIGIEVIPGIEITTAEGDLLALFARPGFNPRTEVTRALPPGRALLETVLKAGDLGAVCIAPHPMAGGMGMRSLSAHSIRIILQHPQASRILIGVEAYNASLLDRGSLAFAERLAERADVARTGSSDAHTLPLIGQGATEFPGRTASDLVAALWTGSTRVHRGRQLSGTQILGGWAADYILSAAMRMNPAAH